jgi:hypothetical protein
LGEQFLPLGALHVPASAEPLSVLLGLDGLGIRQALEDLDGHAGPEARVRVVPGIETDLYDLERPAVRGSLGDPLTHLRHEEALAGTPLAEQPNGQRRLDLGIDDHLAHRVHFALDTELVLTAGVVTVVAVPELDGLEDRPQRRVRGCHGLVDLQHQRTPDTSLAEKGPQWGLMETKPDQEKTTVERWMPGAGHDGPVIQCGDVVVPCLP